jgi:hypothetical protein
MITSNALKHPKAFRFLWKWLKNVTISCIVYYQRVVVTVISKYWAFGLVVLALST